METKIIKDKISEAAKLIAAGELVGPKRFTGLRATDLTLKLLRRYTRSRADLP